MTASTKKREWIPPYDFNSTSFLLIKDRYLYSKKIGIENNQFIPTYTLINRHPELKRQLWKSYHTRNMHHEY